MLSDAEAARRVRRNAWEPRPENSPQNHRIPTGEELRNFYRYRGQWGDCDHLRTKVTGRFTGTTDEIMQWAAWKWGLPEDVLRGAAVSESDWRMGYVGDGGQSFGLFQIKDVERWHGGTFPLSQESTAFNADYYAGMVRHYFEGCARWMADYEHGGIAYRSGDLWGSAGAWFSGEWHDDTAQRYVADVRNHMAQRTWTKPRF